MIKLKRLSDQPILLPKKEHPWEATAVFNCAAIYDNGLVHMSTELPILPPMVKKETILIVSVMQ